LRSHWAFRMPSTRTRQTLTRGCIHTRNAFMCVLEKKSGYQ
jgi:hypothetical protein